MNDEYQISFVLKELFCSEIPVLVKTARGENRRSVEVDIWTRVLVYIAIARILFCHCSFDIPGRGTRSKTYGSMQELRVTLALYKCSVLEFPNREPIFPKNNFDAIDKTERLKMNLYVL
jgi:hypothetical protein